MYVDVKPTVDASFDFGGPFRAEVRGYIDAVKGDAPCRATAQDGVQLMQILDAVYESARTGKQVMIG